MYFFRPLRMTCYFCALAIVGLLASVTPGKSDHILTLLFGHHSSDTPASSRAADCRVEQSHMKREGYNIWQAARTATTIYIHRPGHIEVYKNPDCRAHATGVVQIEMILL